MKLPEAVSQEDLAFGAWNAVLGKRLARHAWPKALVRGNLVIETEDNVWRQNLSRMRAQILSRLTQVVGDGVVRDLDFRLATPRRPPQSAQSAQSTASPQSSDEADRIQDSIFRIVYKQARKKASA